MARLDLRLMPSSEDSECSNDARNSPALEAHPEQPTIPPLGAKRRRAAYADALPRAGNDSFHWLKYGEKLLRDRRTLRHYYRCASRTDTGCNAKKMVDVLVTTGECSWHYREAHNHQSPAGSLSQPSFGRNLLPSAGPQQQHPSNFDLSSQGAAQGRVQFISSDQNFPNVEMSAAALAAMLLAANGGSLLSQRQGTPTTCHESPPSSALQSPRPVVFAGQRGDVNTKNRHLAALMPVSPSPQTLASIPNERHQQRLETLLSSDSTQVSLPSYGVRSSTLVGQLDGCGDGEVKALAAQMVGGFVHGVDSPCSVRSEANWCGDGRRLKKDRASRLSKLGTGVNKLSQAKTGLKRKDQAELAQDSHNAVPMLEEASADHAELELSQGSSCARPEADDLKQDILSLESIHCCQRGSCSWLSLGAGTHHCGCYA